MSDAGTIDYSQFPKSIGELRADKSDKAQDITPRDTLIQCLRLIDSGEWKPKILVVLTCDYPEDGRVVPHYRISSPDPLLTIGLLANVGTRLSAPGEND